MFFISKKAIENIENNKNNITYNRKQTRGATVKLKTPNQLSLLSPATKFMRRRFSLSGLTLNDEQNDARSKSTSININNNQPENFNYDNDIKNQNFMIMISKIKILKEKQVLFLPIVNLILFFLKDWK